MGQSRRVCGQGSIGQTQRSVLVSRAWPCKYVRDPLQDGTPESGVCVYGSEKKGMLHKLGHREVSHREYKRP